ncbi:hypothetical protein NPIL_567621 [Nephila pilipes]|uniref:Uncharacterized protein n=1 Tax=Nephila pilipes TaxID=299642 RepID=A0A8X6P6U8_NEPPI|nr:hypothetical protein NPIL_567621 [Nephila pilipes]
MLRYHPSIIVTTLPSSSKKYGLIILSAVTLHSTVHFVGCISSFQMTLGFSRTLFGSFVCLQPHISGSELRRSLSNFEENPVISSPNFGSELHTACVSAKFLFCISCSLYRSNLNSVFKTLCSDLRFILS